MKNTALTHLHESLGAKMLPFAGYNMPILYEGVNCGTRKPCAMVSVFSTCRIWENFC